MVVTLYFFLHWELSEWWLLFIFNSADKCLAIPAASPAAKRVKRLDYIGRPKQQKGNVALEGATKLIILYSEIV